MAKMIPVTIGVTDFEFTITDRDYNKFVDSITGGKTVLPGYNLLSSTVKNEQHAELKRLVTDGQNNPRATLVMSVIGEITEEFTSDLPAVVKTRKSSANSSKETDLSNS
tara:strand:+ start:244 stop:570 length:327 start_codon:yes stop_codon:yes gene_type:complete